jgi:hypothetical protein
MKKKNLEPFLQTLLQATFRCLVDAEMPATVTKRIVSRAIARAYADKRQLAGSDVLRLSNPVGFWHRNENYLTSSGRPMPLRLTGQRPSVESLVVDSGIREDVAGVIRRLKTRRMIVRDRYGRYVPRRDFAFHATLDPDASFQIGDSIFRLIQTVHTNSAAGSTRRRLIQRTAFVDDLDPDALDQFKSVASSQGGAFASSVDDWLTAHRLRRKTSKRRLGLLAGVHVYAFATRPMSRRRSISHSRGSTPVSRLAKRGGGSSRHLSSGARI